MIGDYEDLLLSGTKLEYQSPQKNKGSLGNAHTTSFFTGPFKLIYVYAFNRHFDQSLSSTPLLHNYTKQDLIL